MTENQAGAEPQPTAIDAIQEDAEPPTMPEGAPEFRSYLKLPFRKRAKFYRAFGALQDKQQEFARLDKKQKTKRGLSRNEMADAAGEYYELLGEMEDLLRIAAKDPDVFEAWMSEVEDDVFSTTFNAYIAWSQPGEASGSAS